LIGKLICAGRTHSKLIQNKCKTNFQPAKDF
jgi:hypothetical protein